MHSTSRPVSVATVEFGARVRAARQERGLSIEQLGAQSGVHWSMVGQVERGLRNLGPHNILQLAAGRHMDPGDLLRGTEPRTEPPAVNGEDQAK